MESILNSVKLHIGVSVDDDHFDSDIILDINSVFSILHQMGVGPEKTFSIVDSSVIWDDFLDDDDFNEVKTYMYLKVKKMFDPPTNANLLKALDEQINELEWRLNVSASNKETEEDEEDDE